MDRLLHNRGLHHHHTFSVFFLLEKKIKNFKNDEKKFEEKDENLPDLLRKVNEL